MANIEDAKKAFEEFGGHAAEESAFAEFGGHADTEQPVATPEKVSMLESGLRGAAQGATMDWADELMGGAKAAAEVAMAPSKIGSLKDLYTKYRDIERSKFKAAETDNPLTYGAAQLATGVAMPMPFGKLGLVKQAAMLGAGQAMGASEDSDVKSLLSSAAIGGTLGAGAGKLGEAVGDFAKKTITPAFSAKAEGAIESPITEKIRSFVKGRNVTSNDEGLRVLQLPASVIKKEKGYEGHGLLLENDYQKGLGIEALERLKFGGGVRPALNDAKNEFAELLTQKAQTLQSAADKIATTDFKVSPTDTFAEHIRKSVSSELEKLEPGMLDTAPIDAVKNNVNKWISRYESADLNPIALDKLRKEVGMSIRSRAFMQQTPELTADTAAMKKIYFALKERTSDLLTQVDPALEKQITNINTKESNLLDLMSAFENLDVKEIQSKGFGHGTNIAGVGGATLGASLMGPAGAPIGYVAGIGAKLGAEKVLGYNLPATASLAFGKANKAIPDVMETIAGKAATPAASQMISRIPEAADMPEAFKKGISESYKHPIDLETNLTSPTLFHKSKEEFNTENGATNAGQSPYKTDDASLTAISEKLLSDPKTSKYGQQMLDAIKNQDQVRKGQLMFVMNQNPSIRPLLLSK